MDGEQGWCWIWEKEVVVRVEVVWRLKKGFIADGGREHMQ
jgi:hypothetical protein